MRFIIALFRFIAFALISIIAISYFMLTGLVLGYGIERSFRLRARYIKVMLKVVNARVKYLGKLPGKDFTGFIVSNHRSYFDPVAILRDIDAVTVAKSQVSNWPIVGLGAKMVGVIWVNRADKDSRKATRDKMVEQIGLRHNIMIFPEGTTHTGEKMLEVRAATFMIAAANSIPVLPVAIEYKFKSDAWVGDDNFVRHFFECFGKWRTDMGVYFAEPIVMQDAEALKNAVVEQVDKNVQFLRKELDYQE